MNPSLAVTRRGTGPMLVCHPGGPGMDPAYLSPVLDLAGGHEVVLVHPRGTPGSPRPRDPHDYSINAYADDLATWLDRHAPGPVALLGHSHGGVVAARLTASRPELVRALILLATPAYGGPRAEAEAQALHRARATEPDCAAALASVAARGGVYPEEAELGRHLAEVIPLWVGPMTDRLRRWQAGIAGQPANVDALRYFNEHVFPDLDRVPVDVAAARCPVLAVAGDLDGWAGPGHLAHFTSRTEVIRGAGHMCHADAMPAIVAVVEEFLLDIEKGGA